jgi:hypothetical protein
MYNTRHTRKYITLKKNNKVCDYIGDLKNEYRFGWSGYFISFFSVVYKTFFNKLNVFNY